MIWYTSDTHYGHKNLVNGCSRWDDKSRCRDFGTLEEHDTFIVDSINNLVREEDTLYHLGDWSFGGIHNVFIFRERIKCKNVHLILGNHDHDIRSNRDECQSVFSSVQEYLEIKQKDHHIVLSHWPMKIWNRSHHGSWQLHGHCHNTLAPDDWWVRYKPKEKRPTMDVRLDTNGLKPRSHTEIDDIFSALSPIKKFGLDRHS